MSMTDLDPTTWPNRDDDTEGAIEGARRAMRATPRDGATPAVAFEVLLGSGVLAAWIAAIYLGLAFFKHLAGPRQDRTARMPQEAPPGGTPRQRRSTTAIPFGTRPKPTTT